MVTALREVRTTLRSLAGTVFLGGKLGCLFEADKIGAGPHSCTRNLAEVARRADIIIAAIGRPHFVTADMVREGAVVIDVGINRVDDPASAKGYKFGGDVATSMKSRRSARPSRRCPAAWGR